MTAERSPQWTKKFSLGSEKVIETPWGICRKISFSREILKELSEIIINVT